MKTSRGGLEEKFINKTSRGGLEEKFQAKPHMLKALFFALVLTFSSGCVVIGAGAASALGGTYYLSGEIKASYPVSIYHLYEVTLYMFQEEGIKTISVTNTKINADIEGELEDGKSVKVHIYYNDKDEATVGIRIGTVGDEKRSRELLKEMERYI